MANAIHGKGGLVYLAPGGVNMTLLGQARSWEFRMDVDLIEQTTLGDLWKTYLNNPMKWEGTIEGNLDTANDTPMQAVTQSVGSTGNTSLLAMYPSSTNMSRFYSGFIWPKLSVRGGIDKTIRYNLDFIGNGALSEN